jgi:hypothetical protein
LAKQASCDICAALNEDLVGRPVGGEAAERAQECCNTVREEIVRLRACFTRGWLLMVRGCDFQALLAFADLYRLATGLGDQAWVRECCGAHEVVRSLCHLLDRGECGEERVLESVARHIDALEETARRKVQPGGTCDREALKGRLRRLHQYAGVEPPALLAPSRAAIPRAVAIAALSLVAGGR